MHKTLLASLVATACIAYVSATANASWTSSISGTVVDVNTVAAVPGATVKAFSATGARVLGKATSDATGAFVIEGLQGGQYRLQFEKPGYQRTVLAGVYVRPGERLIEAGPLAMYPNGAAVPRAASYDPCGLVQPGETADLYVVCGDE